MRRFLITAEAVTEGHPDKIADQIADAILDEIIKQDKYGKCSCEIMVGNNYVVVGGEINSMAWVDYNGLIRKVIKDIGYDKEGYGFCHKNTAIMNAVNRQSADVGRLVRRAGSKKQGAGDQGVSVGYACRETPEMIPLAHAMAQKLAAKLADVRKKKVLGYLRPDGKCQLTMEYRNNAAFRLDNVVISAQHDPNVAPAKIRQDIIDKVIKPVCAAFLDKQTKIFVNHRGRFVIGGPAADTGATGRKIITDAYGSTVPSGGSSFSGKDATKIDRAGAYMARYIAKNIVAADLADECFVRLAYIIGDTRPVEFSVETFGTNKIDEGVLERAAGKVFDLSPGGMIRQLKLSRSIYRKTSNYGHFGRPEPEFTWEKTDKIKDLQKEAAKVSKIK
ncbi:MAG: methionine adenosyltransferase [Candidatus Pacebacteria bacterium]|jgi:S-adenosylmethionine synthetase|nr:methionine adenosyltransferase [Candidatus Paceibacterota bacterium]